MPPRLQEWPCGGDLAQVIGDAVDTLDVSAFHARSAPGGRDQRDSGSPKDTAREHFTDPDRTLVRPSRRCQTRYRQWK